MSFVLIGSLTTGEWIVAIVSAALTVPVLVFFVWLMWRFVEMEDTTVIREIENAQRIANAKDDPRRKVAA
jgi:hypothetical protein